MSNTNENTNKPQPLTEATFNKIGASLARLHEIKSTKSEGLVLTRDKSNNAKELEAEARTLIEFLSEELIGHAQELLGAYVVVKSEYEPLVNALTPAFRRVAATAARQEQAFRDRVARPPISK